jgi:ABC-2 type transport system permease protein
MIRYIKLYSYFLRFSFSKAMEFRIDFFFRIFMDIAFYSVQFLFFKIIYLHTPMLGGWNQEQMILFVCSFIFVDAFQMTFFANNTWWLPQIINRGDLDYYLIRPVSSFFFVAFKEFAANSLVNLLLATFLIGYALNTYPIDFNFFEIVVFFIMLINGAFLYFMTFLLFIFTVFWTGSPRGFSDVFFSAEKIFQRPDGIYSGFFKRFFTTFLPFCAMASFPTRYLLETENRSTILIEVIIASLFIYTLVALVWKRGLRNYSSASS